MAVTDKPLKGNKITKKALRNAIIEKLSGALAEYKDELKEKKFKNKIKKATKLFVVDIKRAAKRKARQTNNKKLQVKK
jgi:hypothetical protein